MTKQQIKWASEHDWYLGPAATDGGILVQDHVVNMNTGESTITAKMFTDFAALRKWAGY